MPLQNINFNDATIQANVVSFNTLSSSNVYFDGLDYYLNTNINGVQYVSKLILKESLPFYNFVYASNTTQQIQNTNILNYLVVDTAVDTFSATFNSFTIGLSNIFVSSNFNSCRLRVNLGPGLSCNKTDIFVTTDAVLSSNTNQFFTFSYFTTGSLLLGFALSGITPQTTPRVPSFPTPTPTRTITPTITPTTSAVSVTLTPTRTPTLTPTVTRTPASTIGVTPTPTFTPTRTVTPTPTRTPASTIGVTPTITITPTITPTSNQGFAVSSTNQVILGNTGGYDGLYTKSEYDPTYWGLQYSNITALVAPNYSSNTTGVWVLWNADQSEPIYEVISGSSNINYIPTIGWSPVGMTVSLPPTPTPTISITPTTSAVLVTPTPTFTPTRTVTPTPTRTPASTIGVTPTITITPTRTPTPTTSTAAPSGINPATPANLLITFADQVNGSYQRSTPGVHINWYQFIDGGEECKLDWTGTIWRLRRVINGDFAGPYGGEATNNTGNVNSIPTTGWVYTITDYGSPTITITAA